MWTSRTSIDNALTGDHCAGTLSAYASGGFQSRQFDSSPSGAEIRTINDFYISEGLTCEAAPAAPTQTHAIPNDSGEVKIATTAGYIRYSQHPHLHLPSRDSLYGVPIAWPSCIATGEQQIPF